MSLSKVVTEAINKVSIPKPVQKKSNDFSFFGVKVNSKSPFSSVKTFANILLSPFTNTNTLSTNAELSLGFFFKCPVMVTGLVKCLKPKRSVATKIVDMKIVKRNVCLK